MRVTLTSTTKIVQLVDPKTGQSVPARIWEGETEAGVRVHAYVTRIACDRKSDAQEFERELQECRPPSPEIEAIPLRLIL